MQIRLGLSLTMQRSGGGAAPSAPVVVIAPSIIAQPLVGVPVEMDEGMVTGATSTTYQWYRGAPPTTPISGATSAGPTPADTEYNFLLYRRTTYTNAAGSTVVDTAAPGVTGKVFFENFSGMTNGDVTATILAYGWTRSTTGIDVQAVTDADAPSGKGMDWWGTANSFRNIYRNDWDSFSNANSADPYEELFFYKHQTAVPRMSLRPHNGAGTTGANAGPGFSIRLNNVYAQLPGDDPDATVGTLVRALTVGLKYWFRKRSIGSTCYYKVWLSTVPEPEFWDVTRVHGSALANRGPSLGYRQGAGTDKQRVLYMSSAHNAAAPYPVGFELPLPTSADAMTYAASSAATSFAQNDSAIVYTVGDI